MLDAARNHRIFTGVARVFPWGGLQYLAFVRDGHDGLIRDLFGVSGAAPVFAHPIWSPTGVVPVLTGVGPVAIMASWKLVSVVVLFAGGARLVSRHIPPRRPGRRLTALGLCLFGRLTPLAFVWNGDISGLRGRRARSSPRRNPVGLRADSDRHRPDAVRHRGDGPHRRRQRKTRHRPSSRFPRDRRRPGLLRVPQSLDFSWSQFSQTDATRLALTWPVLEYCLAPLVVVLVCARAARRDRGARSMVVWRLATLALVALRAHRSNITRSTASSSRSRSLPFGRGRHPAGVPSAG